MNSRRHWTIRYLHSHVLESFPRLRLIREAEQEKAFRIRCAHRTNETFHIFKYTVSGTGYIERDGVRHRVGPGSAFLCTANDPQIAYGHWGDDAAWRFLLATFWGGDEQVRELTDAHGHVFDLPPECPSIAWMAGQKPRNPDRGSCQTVTAGAGQHSAIVFEILQELFSVYHDSRSQRSGHRLIIATNDLIDQHLTEPINVQWLADQQQISASYLCKIYKRETGATILQTLNTQKMNRAHQLLAATTLTVRDIAESLGYSDLSHFSRLFKRVIGVSPIKARQEDMIILQ